MPRAFEELDWRATPMGELVLRRRETPARPGTTVYEVKLDGEMLMSSLVTESERALATLALARLGGRPSDVLVGGLGLGYTARAALDVAGVRAVTVVEYMTAVIDWHRRGLVPLGRELCAEPRCRIVQGDFFALIADPATPRYDAVLVDIDHSPADLLHPSHAAFYEADGLRRLAARLRDGGVFALWSADPPDNALLARLIAVFGDAETHTVTFFNPHVDAHDHNTIYLATPLAAGCDLV